MPGAGGARAFVEALKMQGRVIKALLMRELHTRYGRDNIGYLWVILEPMMLASAVALLHAEQGNSRYTSDVRPVPFAIIGYCVFIIFRGIFTRAESALESNRPLLYHRMVTILDMLLARALLETAGIGATTFILLGVAYVFGFADLPARPLWLFAAIGYMVWFSLAMSMLCCAVTHDNRLAGRLIHPATYIFLPLSGAFYLVSWVPEPYRAWVLYIPTVHILEMARYGQFEAGDWEYFDVLFITNCCLVLTTLGLLSIQIVRRHVHLS